MDLAAHDAVHDDRGREHIGFEIRLLTDDHHAGTRHLAFDLPFELDLSIELEGSFDAGARAEERAFRRQWLTHRANPPSCRVPSRASNRSDSGSQVNCGGRGGPLRRFAKVGWRRRW